MKKKFLIFMALLVGVVSLTACGKSNINLANYLIEERNNLFTAADDLYCVSFSTGMREENYQFDGEVGNKVEFGVITFARNDREPMANDNYTYLLTVGEESFTGFLEKSPVDNTYSVDIGKTATDDALVSIQITFTGYSFNKEMSCTSKEFAVDKNAALEIANKNLSDELKNICADKNNKIEVVMKIMKDYSTENKTYFWYVGVVSTNADTLGILIDANSGDVVAIKK